MTKLSESLVFSQRLAGKAGLADGPIFTSRVNFRDSNFWADFAGPDPRITFDNGDWFNLDRGNNRFGVILGASERVRFAAGDTYFYGGTFHSFDVRPSADAAFSLGNSSLRWNQVYAATGSINTSDMRYKTVRGALTENELAAAREISRDIKVFQFNNAIAEKGVADARLHVGVLAQHVVSIMESHGLDPMRYGFVCHDVYEAREEIPAVEAVEEVSPLYRNDVLIREGVPGRAANPGMPGYPAGDVYGIRDNELQYFLIAAQEQRLSVLEAL